MLAKLRTAQAKCRSAAPLTPPGSTDRRLPTTSRVIPYEFTENIRITNRKLPFRYRGELKYLLCRQGRRQFPSEHPPLDLGTTFADRGVGQHPVQHRVANHLPGPVHLLGAPPCLELPRLAQYLAMVLDGFPQLFQPSAFQRAHGENRWAPEGFAGVNQSDCSGEVARGRARLAKVLAIGFVHDDDVSQLQHEIG